MKKLCLLLFLVILTGVNYCPAQSPAKEKIYTLQKGESLVYGENCFYFSDQGKEIFIVVKNGDNFFTIENGVRKGPFKKNDNFVLKSCKQESNNCAVYKPKENLEENIFDLYITQNEDGTASIKFNGKNYGPFLSMVHFQVSDDKTKFAAVVKEMNGNNKFLMSNGKSLQLDGLAGLLKLSPDGSFALMKIGFDYTNPNLDPSTINLELLSKISIVTSEGVKLGPFNSETVNDNDLWFTNSTGNHWFLKNGDDLLLDGKPFIKMPEGIGNCEMWFSTDLKRYAFSTYEKVQFSDGTSIPYPFQISLFYKDGRTFLRCVTFENEQELNVYTKAL